MTILSWDEVCKRAVENNKTLVRDVEKKYGKRYFNIICNFCSTEKNSTFKDFNKCKVCSDSLRIKNVHNFINDAKQIHSDKYNYDLVEYVNSYSKVKIKCNDCDNVFLQQPSSHLLGRGCSICSKNKKLDTTEFIYRSKQIHSNKYNYDLVEYINSYSKVKIKCNDCDNVFHQSASDHMRGRGCNVCFSNSRKTNIEDFICMAKNIHGDKFNYDLVDYINKRTKVKIKCNECNIIFLQTPGSHLQGRGCRNCQIIISKDSLESFIIKAKSVHKDRFNYDSVKYIGSVIKVKIFCIECNDFFEQRPGDHLRGIGCPKCKESKGENKISKYLAIKNINFIAYKGFDSLRYKNPLKCDFYLSDLNIIIEYDGKGHYIPCFGSTPEEKQKNLEDCQLRDKVKDEWAKANNIPLLRIPYWDFDKIEELIEAFILEHTSPKEIKQLALEI